MKISRTGCACLQGNNRPGYIMSIPWDDRNAQFQLEPYPRILCIYASADSATSSSIQQAFTLAGFIRATSRRPYDIRWMMRRAEKLVSRLRMSAIGSNRTASILIEEVEKEKDVESSFEQTPTNAGGSPEEINFFSYHEFNAGRLVVDPEEAKLEFGEHVANRLKLSSDGTKVLWPQPTDFPEDPQNWSDFRKHLQLLIVTLAAIVPDFDSGIGIASIFALAKQYDTTTGVINNLTSNWSIFLVGWGGIFAVMLIRRFGRLPVLFWSQVLALGFMVGCTFAPNLKTFAVDVEPIYCSHEMPDGIFWGLYIVTDLFPFHLQARKVRFYLLYKPETHLLNLWSTGFIMSPFLSPFAFGFLVARAEFVFFCPSYFSYLHLHDQSELVIEQLALGLRHRFHIRGSRVLLIMFFGEENVRLTSMFDRTLSNPMPIPRPPSGLRYRIELLVGITGLRMAKYRIGWRESIFACINVIWRPHLLGALIFEGMLFGFGIGINVTNAVFLGMPLPVGYGFSQFAIAGAYATPIVAVIIGELLGRYFNDWIMNICIRRNRGVFEAESRLWTCYIALPLYICGFLVLGASFQNHFSVGALVMGWGIAEVAIMINTVAIYAYCIDCFPRQQGEISALINLARCVGGFSVAYFQVPWAVKNGTLQTFGVEAAIVVALFLLIVPALQIKGVMLRV
ncbi:hypothetical protein A0H81_02079, partial [Grifola frondosa]